MLKVTSYEINVYINRQHHSPFMDWLYRLDNTTSEKIQQRIGRIKNGNFGDYKKIDKDIYELRLFFGPGYRVYFGKDGEKLIIILAGGNKSGQNKDIKSAKKLWLEYVEIRDEK